jgi:uncharacterized protein
VGRPRRQVRPVPSAEVAPCAAPVSQACRGLRINRFAIGGSLPYAAVVRQIPREQTRVRRHPERATYESSAIAEILDAGFVCHVATVRDDRPVVVPTLYARQEQRLILHGSPVAGMFRDTRKRPEVCVTVTHLDALVLARSAFHHSANYRSVVVHGEAVEIADGPEKFEALRVLLEHIVPGRWNTVRSPSPAELRQTSVYAVSLEDASAKVRTGPPKDDDDDLALPVWAGVLAFSHEPTQLVPDEHVRDGVAAPSELLASAQRSG